MLQERKPLLLWLAVLLGVFLPLNLPEVTMQELDKHSEPVLLYLPQSMFYPNENYIISQCEQETLNLIKREHIYTDKTGRLSFPNFAGLQNKLQDRRVYEKEKLQMPFECITRYIMNGSYFAGIEDQYRFQDLIFRCESSQPPITCESLYPFRTFDGSCNNLAVPRRGSVQTCARRLMPASYEGVSDFRKSKCGTFLPNPRLISNMLFKDKSFPNPQHSNILTYFSQFLSHDITDLPTSHVYDSNIDCCSNPSQQHPQCAPILLPLDDPYTSRLNITCLGFVRAAPCPSCSLGKRNQMIQVTSYIDASTVYGLSYQEANNLRLNDGTGRLIEQNRDKGIILPPDFGLGFCGDQEHLEYCFRAGDRRANQHAPLMTFHTIFLREHNRLATILKKVNPHWSEETLFMEARKILIAEMQVITYKEFLPLLLGSEMMTEYDLWLGTKGKRTQYDFSIDPTMLIEFSAGAYRLHNIISGIVTNYATDGDKKTLPDFTRDASTLYHGQMTELLGGMCLNPSKMFSRHVPSEITDPVYRRNPETAFDLSAIDIQRGRDAGVPPYTEVLNYLSGGAINIQTFEDLSQVINPADIKLLKTVYCDPGDIDFLVGMYFERVPGKMMISRSSAQIIAQQFRDLKFGDRFYVEHFTNFNDNQLSTLRDFTIARLICDNTLVTLIQHFAMRLPSLSNVVMACSEIPGLNLNFWKDSQQLRMQENTLFLM